VKIEMMKMSGDTKRPHRKLSFQAEALLELLLTLADEHGFVQVTRPELAKYRSVPVPTIARTLRELITAGELELVKRGGRRSRPSQCRIVRLSRERVHVRPTLEPRRITVRCTRLTLEKAKNLLTNSITMIRFLIPLPGRRLRT